MIIRSKGNIFLWCPFLNRNNFCRVIVITQQVIAPVLMTENRNCPVFALIVKI